MKKLLPLITILVLIGVAVILLDSSSYLINKGFGIIIIYLNLNSLEMINEFNSLEARVINIDTKNHFFR